MPDSRTHSPPRDWDDAFHALPLETPAAGSWHAVAARLPAQAAPALQRRRWKRPVALAAAVALAALLPAQWLIHSTQRASSLSSPPISATSQPAPSPHIASVPDDMPPMAAAPAERAMDDTPDAAVSARTHTPASVGLPPATQVAVSLKGADSAGDGATPGSARLDALYSESAQLEAVLAQLPEARMTNAATQALSAGLQDRVASIDVALSQPYVPPQAQADLWQDRVDTLRQLTGVETTQRWQVARNDASPSDISIY